MFAKLCLFRPRETKKGDGREYKEKENGKEEQQRKKKEVTLRH
jgi:hypothetical protein